MAELLVKNIAPSLAAKLRRRAAEHGVSDEQELMRILDDALGHEPSQPPAGIPVEAGAASDDWHDDWIFSRSRE